MTDKNCSPEFSAFRIASEKYLTMLLTGNASPSMLRTLFMRREQLDKRLSRCQRAN